MKTISKTYELLHYKEEWEDFKKEFNLTEEEARDEIESELQITAWGDIITQRAEFLRNEKKRCDKKWKVKNI